MVDVLAQVEGEEVVACTRPVAVKRCPGSLSTFATDLVPCGNCIGCDLERSRQWAVRCMHEASCHTDNAFVTLTYDDAHVPAGGSLDPSAFPLFMRRLRKEAPGVRYFACGEYGEQFGRPHYHALLFGYWPGDAVASGERGGYPVWRSGVLSSLWPFGFSELGSVTFDSAGYVARYVTKKVRGIAASEHYSSVDPETGELVFRTPEFSRMSRRPGIGAAWFGRYGDELEPKGTVIVAGKEVPTPRYYRKLMAKSSAAAAEELARVAARRCFVREPAMNEVQLDRNEQFLMASHNLQRGLE